MATGWETVCVSSIEECDVDSAIYTRAGGSITLRFYGDSIDVIGNVTDGMRIVATLDGLDVSSKVPPPGSNSIFTDAGFEKSTDEHVLELSATPLSSTSMLVVRGAKMVVSTWTNGVMSTTYVDDTDPQFSYNGFSTVPTSDDPLPVGITNHSVHISNEAGSSANLTFHGVRLVLYGPCAPASGTYTVQIDDLAPTTHNASTNAFTSPLSNHSTSSCVQYLSPFMDPRILHTFSLSNTDGGRTTAFDYVQIVYVNPDAESPASSSGLVAGVTVGSIVAVIAIFCLYCRYFHGTSIKALKKRWGIDV